MTESEQRFAKTGFGEIAYRAEGTGPVALFVHGVFLNGELWAPVRKHVRSQRTCICPDLLAHGDTRESSGVDVSFAGQAEMLAELIDGIGAEQVDLVGNDSGGGICQILAATHPDKVRSLTLTNCDTHDGWPPEALKPTHDLAANGELPGMLRALAADPGLARDALSVGLQFPEKATDETLRGFLMPLIRSEDRIGAVVDMLLRMDCAQTVAIEPRLRSLEVPALIVWGDADPFFEMKWAYWLRDALPGCRRLVELRGAKLFFPLERAEELAIELLALWEPEALLRGLAQG